MGRWVGGGGEGGVERRKEGGMDRKREASAGHTKCGRGKEKRKKEGNTEGKEREVNASPSTVG